MSTTECANKECVSLGSIEFVSCSFCKDNFHLKCYNLTKAMVRGIGEHANISFTCDDCKKTVNPTTVTELLTYKFKVQSDIEAMKTSLLDINAIVRRTDTNMPPPDMFSAFNNNIESLTAAVKAMPTAQMLGSLNEGIREFTNSVKSFGQTGAVNNSNNEAMVGILRDIETSLKKVNNEPKSNNDELKGILFEIQENVKKNTEATTRRFTSPQRNINGKRSRTVDTDNRQPMQNIRIECNGPSSEILIPVERNILRSGKSIVISPLQPSMTTDKIIDYLKTHLEDNFDPNALEVFSLAPKERENITFISFKINATNELYEKLTEPAFWPTGVDVRDFVMRPRKPRGAVF